MEENAKHTSRDSGEHGSVTSYVIGFVLSLVLTIIPYYMVTRGITTGNTLLLTILGFAILQMFVQIFFFLHLGRGPKPLYNVIFFAATAGLIVMVIGASIIIMDNLNRNMSPREVTTRLAQEENIAEVGGQETGACQGNKGNHTVIIKKNEVSPSIIVAKRCDTLTITIEDGIDRMIMFGTDEAPVSYGGMDDVMVRSDRSKIITLNETGEYSFHDHSNKEVTGTFIVEPETK